MKKSALTAILVALTLFALALPGYSVKDAPHVAYTKHFLQHYPKRLHQALELMPLVEGYSSINAVPMIAVVVIIAAESSWKIDASGTVGEHGLMQVHGTCAKGYNLKTPEGQIAAGTACLAKAYESCDGSLKQALIMFQSGSCHARTKRTKRRIAYRLSIIKKWSR